LFCYTKKNYFKIIQKKIKKLKNMINVGIMGGYTAGELIRILMLTQSLILFTALLMLVSHYQWRIMI
jgi:hypothetical protein